MPGHEIGRRLTVIVGLLLTSPGIPAQPKAKNASQSATSLRPQLIPGEFPAEGTATRLGGELIQIDHINRSGILRMDRTDNQRRSEWDLPLSFTLLPYGSVWYHGAPAELQDIPLGTHVHGEFYWDDAMARNPRTQEDIAARRISPDSGFHWVLRLEDDTSYSQRLGRRWRIDAIHRDQGTLSATEVGRTSHAESPAKPELFQYTEATRIWQGNGLGSLSNLQVGNIVLMNFTYRTMKLSGRITDIWIDEESRQLARAHQLAHHRVFAREHGLFGRIDAVDDKTSTLAITMFDGFDPQLREDFDKPAILRKVLSPPYVSIAVAEESRMMYDPVNDVKRAPILEMREVPVVPGCSGWQIVCRPETMLEGFRLKRIVSVRAGLWGVADLPREEKKWYQR